MYFKFLIKHDYSKYMILINEFRESHLSKEEFNLLYDKIFMNGEIWVVKDDDGNIIGTATILFEQKFIHNGAIVAHIEDVIIKSNVTSKGYGTKLINHLLSRTREKKCYKTILNCSSNVVKFYEKCGFSQKNFQMELRNSEFEN